MNKKVLICFLSVIFSIIFLELTLQIVPVIYKILPKTNKNIYICVIGESFAYGHPYQGKLNFSKIIGKMTNWKIDNKNMEIIYLASNGDNLFLQYKKYLTYKLLHPLRKNIILGYFGMGYTLKNDDISNFNFILNFRLLDFLFFNNNFKYEYEKILNIIKKYGDELYISTIVGNYSGVMPNNVESLIKNKNLKKELKTIDNLILNKKYDYALEKTNELLKIYTNESQVLYRIGKIYEKQQKIKEANLTYKKMINPEDLRPTIEENKTIRNLVKKYNLTLVDIDEYIYNKNEIIGYNYFVDIAHPTINFDIFIAQKFIEKLKQNYKIDIADNDIKKQIENELSYEDWFIVYRDALGEIFYYSYYKNVIFDVYNKELILNYIDKLYKIHNKIEDKTIEYFSKREEIIHICETLFEYIQGNKEDTIKLINDYNLKDIILQREKKGKEKMQCWWYMKHWLIDFIIENKI